MILKKYNYIIHEYEDYKIPDDWNVPLLTDLEDIVNCPHCGKRLNYGDTYTSLEIHSDYGLGYGVCSNCYNEEQNRRKLFKGR